MVRRPGAGGQLRGPERDWAAGVGTAGSVEQCRRPRRGKFQVRAQLGSRSATAAEGQGSVTRPGVNRAAGGGTAGSVDHIRPPLGSGRCRGRINEPSPGTASQPPQPWCHGFGPCGPARRQQGKRRPPVGTSYQTVSPAVSRSTDSDPAHPVLIDLAAHVDKQIEEKLCQLAPKSFPRLPTGNL